jgi:cyanate permease
MTEVFPVVAGLVIGLVVDRLANPRWRAMALVALCLIAGVAASFISGELFVSWDFLFVDIPLVFLAAVVMTLGLVWWRRRQTRHS